MYWGREKQGGLIPKRPPVPEKNSQSRGSATAMKQGNSRGGVRRRDDLIGARHGDGRVVESRTLSGPLRKKEKGRGLKASEKRSTEGNNTVVSQTTCGSTKKGRGKGREDKKGQKDYLGSTQTTKRTTKPRLPPEREHQKTRKKKRQDKKRTKS